jgi:hypothetical protein
MEERGRTGELTCEGAVTREPKKRPKSSYIRFAAAQPNETWQSDFTHYRLTRPGATPGTDVEIITWLDDHSRYALHISAHQAMSYADWASSRRTAGPTTPLPRARSNASNRR